MPSNLSLFLIKKSKLSCLKCGTLSIIISYLLITGLTCTLLLGYFSHINSISCDEVSYIRWVCSYIKNLHAKLFIMSPSLQVFLPIQCPALYILLGPQPSTLKRILIPCICLSFAKSFSRNKRVPLVLIAILALGAVFQIRSTVLGKFLGG